MPDVTKLPTDLPEPEDDGACDHLIGVSLPDVNLESTSGTTVSLRDITKDLTVFYLYPMTGRPDRDLPEGWNLMPGARGCTPQSCAFRDHYQDLKNLGAKVYGISTQVSDYQREAKERLHLPYDLLSDAKLELVEALGLPTTTVPELASLSPDISTVLVKRITLIVAAGKIKKVFYPVFPPDQNAQEVLRYLVS